MRVTKKGYLLIGMGLSTLTLLILNKFVSKGKRFAARIEGRQQGLMQISDVALGKTKLAVSDDSAKTRMEVRKKHLQKACSVLKLDEYVADQRGLEVTLAHGRLKFCGLEKVGSTFMKDIKDKENADGQDKHAPPGTHYKTFVIVREPYARLVSAYIDKIFLRTIWWGWYGKIITQMFRYHNAQRKTEKYEKATKCGSDVTFHEFIRFWIYVEESGHKKNGHFTPMHEECRFCYFDYDYYVHLETIKDDIGYIYETVNQTLNSSMTNEKDTLLDMAGLIIEQREKGEYKGCEEMCTVLDRAWWTFQGRALISQDIPNPITGAKCDTITKEEFTNIAWDAHLNSVGKMDKSKQRRQMMVGLYLQLPLLDRLKVRELLLKDFKLHNYDSMPADMFPEIM